MKTVDLWPPVRKMPDGTPCWCASDDEPHDGWTHAPVCTARRKDRVLVIDDLRHFRFPATYARTLWEAESLLLRPDGWDEVWWDHDLGPTTTRGLAATLERMAVYGVPPRCGRVVVHTSNPAGRDWLTAALVNVYGQAEFVDAADYVAR
jgi:hypothetical protein